MASYYVESIERITEQTIEKEIREDIEEIRVDVNENVSSIKNNTLSYIESNKVELASFGNDSKEYAEQIYSDIIQINEDTDAIAEDTIAEIENNIRQMIVDNGYVMKVTDDGNGNANMVLVKEV